MNDSSSFIHLHVHSEYSLLDGAIRIDKMLEKARGLGMDSVALTDHGNMFGAVDFYDKAVKAGVRPVIGSEVYVAPGDRRDRSISRDGSPTAYHLVLLVMNDEGYRNLSRLVTKGHMEGFYYRPRIDMELLRRFNKGLVALSACLKGHIPYLIGSGRVEAAMEKAKEFESIFNGGRFYLEVQGNGLEEQVKVNQVLRNISKELSIPLVATNDCHYLEPGDAEAHDVLLCIQTGKTLDDEQRLAFSGSDFYFKSRTEMVEALPGFEDAIDNTSSIAAMCDYDMEFGKYKYPVFNAPEDQSLDEMLAKAAEEGLTERLALKERAEGKLSPEDIREYKERLGYELGIIHKMGFSGYFLIVADFINYARGRDIPVGPGRGSAAGSLVAYCLKITNIDPIRYGLLFERFLNPARISMPDIDIDFCINGRDDIIHYVSEKYGRENVGQIITFGTMKARGAIRDVGRTLNIPLGEVDRIAKLVPEGPGVTLEQALKDEPELRKLQEQDDSKRKLLEISRAIEGLARHASTHACGVVIADRPLVDYLPLFKGPKDEVMTQFTMELIEKLGLIKFDFLGLKTLTVIKKALELIRDDMDIEVDIENIPMDDAAAYQLCSDGKTTGVFQLESGGMKELLRRLKPETFEDMIALVALYRPGPLGSNMVDDFIKGKHGKSRVKYFLPELEPILEETYGVILYQEQVMKIAQLLAAYSMAEADELRKAVGKKKQDVIAGHKARFVKGACENGVDGKKAETLFELIDKFGGYGFNKSHSAAYAMIAYQTAYLKAHFPVQFMASLLTMDMENQDKTIKNIAESREMGIEILPPDVNESRADFSVINGKIRFGLAAVKNVGYKAVESMLEERDLNGPFRDLVDFCKRVDGAKVNKRVLEGLIQCGAFDFTGVFRSRLYGVLDRVLKFCGAHRDPNQLSIFGAMGVESDTSGLFDLPEVDEWDESELLRREKECLGFYITAHPLDRYSEEISRYITCVNQDLSIQEDKAQLMVAGVVGNLKIKRTKKGDKMAVFDLEDKTGSTEIVVFPELFNSKAHFLKGEEPLLVKGSVERSESAVKMLAQDIDTLERVRQKAVNAVEVRLRRESVTDDLLEDLEDIAFRYPGDCRLLFRVDDGTNGQVVIAAGSGFRIFPCREFINEIESLTGDRAIEVIC